MAGVSVEKRGDKYRYVFYVASEDGQRKRKTGGGFRTEAEAMAAGIADMAKYNKTGTVFVPSSISFADYMNQWLEEYCVANLKTQTVASYRKRIRHHLLPVFAGYRLKDITPSAVQKFLNDKFQEGYGKNTLTNLKGILSRSFDYAIEPLRLIENNPVNATRIPSGRAKPKVATRSAPHAYITPDRMDLIFKRFPEGTSAHIPLLLGYKCGLRIGEAFAVQWADIDFEQKILHLKHQVQWSQADQAWYLDAPKYNSIRDIDLDDSLIAVLLREKDRQEKAPAYFGSRLVRLSIDDNQYINTDGIGEPARFVTVREDGSFIAPRIMQHATRVIQKELRFEEFDFHSLRHTHATMLMEAGAPIKYIQSRLGHKKLNVTVQVYQHMTEIIGQQGREALDRMEKIIHQK